MNFAGKRARGLASTPDNEGLALRGLLLPPRRRGRSCLLSLLPHSVAKAMLVLRSPEAMAAGTLRLPLLVLLAQALLRPAPVCCGERLVVGIEGKDIVLSPVFEGNLTEIIWKKGYDKVAERDNSDFKGYMPFKRRTAIDWKSGSLTIKNLTLNDIGTYSAEALVGEEYQYTKFLLKILAPPHINCSVKNDSIQLICTPTNQDPSLNYLWKSNERAYISDQPSVNIPKNEARPEKITCIITLENSKASSFINLRECIPVESAPRTRNRIALIFAMLLTGITMGGSILFLLQRGPCRTSKMTPVQQHPEPPKDKEEQQPLNVPRHDAENVREDNRKAIAEGPEPSPKEEDVPHNGPKSDRDSSENLEENNKEDIFDRSERERRSLTVSRDELENVEENRKRASTPES